MRISRASEQAPSLPAVRRVVSAHLERARAAGPLPTLPPLAHAATA